MQLDRADVVIVGAGIVGVCTAWFLAERGADVVIVEQRQVGSGASGRNVGYLWMQTRDTGTALSLSRAGRSLYQEFAAELGDCFQYRANGGMFFFTTDEQRQVFQEFVELRQAEGLHIELLDGKAARAAAPILPPSVLGATYCAEDAQIDTRSFVRALSAACQRRGVRIYEGVTATGFLRNGEGVRGVSTNWGVVPAGSVVWCGGAWTQLLDDAGLKFPARLERLTALRTAPVPETLQPVLYGPFAAKQYKIMRGLPSFREEKFTSESEELERNAEIVLTVAKTAEHKLLVGCMIEHPEKVDELPSAACIRTLISTFIEIFPAYASLPIEKIWSGVIAASMDSLPIVGDVADVPGLFLAGGYIYGNVAGPSTGRMLAARVAGEPPSAEIEQLGLSRASLQRADPSATRW
jgi:glycine/D-amino acid oxidase-like deaminating enzyme